MIPECPIIYQNSIRFKASWWLESLLFSIHASSTGISHQSKVNTWYFLSSTHFGSWSDRSLTTGDHAATNMSTWETRGKTSSFSCPSYGLLLILLQCSHKWDNISLRSRGSNTSWNFPLISLSCWEWKIALHRMTQERSTFAKSLTKIGIGLVWCPYEIK